MNRQTFVAQVQRLMVHFRAEAFNPEKIEAWWQESYFLRNADFIKGVDKIIQTRVYPDMPQIAEVLQSAVGDQGWRVPAQHLGDIGLDDILKIYKLEYETWLEKKKQIGQQLKPKLLDNTDGGGVPETLPNELTGPDVDVMKREAEAWLKERVPQDKDERIKELEIQLAGVHEAQELRARHIRQLQDTNRQMDAKIHELEQTIMRQGKELARMEAICREKGGDVI